MMRTYRQGEIVGEIDSSFSFKLWLRSEIDQAEQLDKRIDDRIMSLSTPRPRLATVAAAHARLRALREVQLAYARSQESHE